MTLAFLRGIFNSETPYFAFPEKPDIIKIDGIDAYNYITGHELDKLIKKFSETVNLRQFDYICVNQMGGGFFAHELMRLQKYKGKLIDIEYHENRNVVLPIPEHLKKAKLAVIDDVLDRFITGGMIQKDAPQASLFYLTKKRNVIPNNQLHNCQWASEVDNQWLLGGGMNGETESDGYPENWGRTYHGIAVKIQS